jgi:TonB family protein
MSESDILEFNLSFRMKSILRQLFLVCFFVAVHLVTAHGQDAKTRSQNNSTSYEDPIKALEEHVGMNLSYPEDALLRGIQGIVYVHFEIDSAGNMMQNSVRSASGLLPSCDREAERVVKTFKKKWMLPFRKMVANRYVFNFPVKFAILDSDQRIDFPRNLLEGPIQTVIIPKTFTAKSFDWPIYKLIGMKEVGGKVSPGDSVSVVGWGAWTYFVQGKNVTGYVSHNAVQITSALDSLSKVVKDQSDAEDELETSLRKFARVDTIYNFSSETAYLSVTANKKEIFVGECTNVELAFNVKESNVLGLQFVDLGSQLASILNKELKIYNCLVIDNHIENIAGIERFNADEKYTSYSIREASYCPTTLQPIRIPSVKLKLLLWKQGLKKIDKVLQFSSAPITIKVKPLPTGLVISEDSALKMVGKFSMEEQVDKTPLIVGKPFFYRIIVKGEGSTFVIKPPKFTYPEMKILLQDILDSDTIINEVARTSKTFVYRVMPMRAGGYDFKDKIIFSFFNPVTGKKETLRSVMKVEVAPGIVTEPIIEIEKFFSKTDFIACDISQSMMIQDYVPSRLHVVKNGLKGFYSSRQQCDVGLIVFGGEAKHVEQDIISCYPGIDSISTNEVKNGTAIGDAIWLATISRKQNTTLARLVIIGDGDNTAGQLLPADAAAYAKKNNVRIYAIGIGNSGIVPYGQDALGRPNMINDTFSDKDLKEIARMTGGEYYWAKNADEVSSYLRRIFKNKQ